MNVEDKLYHLLSDHWGNGDHAPSTSTEFRFSTNSWPEIASLREDSSVVWIGTMSEWHTNFERRDARRLGWWLLWDWWVKGEWFGWRRWAWYKLLRRRVAKYGGPPVAEVLP